MSKNPFYNALAAIIYILTIVLAINSISDLETNEYPLSLVTPVLVLSLFTLSAAVMGYLFCFQPLRLYLDGKKEEAVKLFLKTVAIFAIIPLTIFLLYFFQSNTLNYYFLGTSSFFRSKNFTKRNILVESNTAISSIKPIPEAKSPGIKSIGDMIYMKENSKIQFSLKNSFSFSILHNITKNLL